MSSFLGFDSYLVPLGASIADAHNAIKDVFTARGWQILASDSTTNPTRLDLAPPATETIGGSGAFDFLRMTFSGTIIKFYALKKWTREFPQQVYLAPKTGGAVTVSCTLNGSTVSYVGTAANTATDNLLGLYAAIRDSADANFLAWNWDVSYPATQNGNDTSLYIYGINSKIEANKTFAINTNINGGIFSNYTPAGYITSEALAASPSSLTIDLVSGFIYYLQVNARGIAMATKTNVGYYGPVHACWGNNDAAVSYLPADSKFTSPIELLVGYDDGAGELDSWGKTSTAWLLSPYSAALANAANGNYSIAGPASGVRRHRFTDAYSATSVMDYGSHFLSIIRLCGSGVFWDEMQVGNDFQVHRVKAVGYNTLQAGLGSGPTPYPFYVLPGFEVEDWYKFRGTATNESLVLVADTVTISPLAANYAIGDNVIKLVDTSMFAPVGFVVIGGETLQYTGKNDSTNTLTGVTGGKYATLAARHFSGDSAGQGLWFVVINGGALLAGYVKPI